MLDRTKPYSDEMISALLRRHQIKPTQQRVVVARLLFERCAHFSADEVYRFVNTDDAKSHEKPEAAKVSKATVYNTLGLFVRKGLIREVIADPQKVFYDPNTQPHHHLYNITTGELEDINAQDIEVSALPPLPEGMELESVEVIVRTRQQAG